MESFKLINQNNKSINRSIRLSETLNNKLCTISEATGISYNKIVVKCIDFALSHMAANKKG